MPILNYTTSIDPHKTVSQIHALLAAKGATNIGTDYSNGKPSAVTFSVIVHGSLQFFRLPTNTNGVLAAMKRDKKVPRTKCTPEQAERVTWRIILNWVEAQMAIIEAGQAELAEVFLPYLVINGESAYRHVIDRITDSSRMLTNGVDYEF